MSGNSIRLMIVRESHQLSAAVAALAKRERVHALTSYSCQDALQQLQEFNPTLLLIDSPASTPPGGVAACDRLWEALDTQGVACLLVASQEFLQSQSIPEWVQVMDYDGSSDELWGRLAAVWHTQESLRRSQLEMRYMTRLGKHLNKQFSEVDQDMRLASRLQKEFLPRQMPDIPGMRFSILFRPASWVSGDIYDVSRVDEEHVGIYVADAVGHGMAASLLTMYVKRGITCKEISGSSYRILTPSETLQKLNDELAAEDLNNSQFVTASYALLNHKTRTMQFARGGHPYPILVEPDGTISELKTEGGLLGLFAGQEFQTKQITLKPGQKVIIYSDGMELAFVEDRDAQTGEPRYQREFQRVALLSASELTAKIEEMMDAEEGSLNPRDDVTIIVLEVLP